MTESLKRFIFHNGISEKEFSRVFRISQPYLNQILNGKRKCGKKMAEYLEKATGGNVKKRDLRPDIW